MTSSVQTGRDWGSSPWRYLMWAAAAALVAAALWAWEAVRQGEYGLIIVAAIFASVCMVVERAASRRARWAYGAGMAIAVLTGLGQLWMNMAVGLIGSEDNPINAMFFAVVGLALLAGLAVLGRARRMVWVMGAAAIAQVAAGVVGVTVQLDDGIRAGGMVLLTLYFAALWLNSAALFRIAAARAE